MARRPMTKEQSEALLDRMFAIMSVDGFASLKMAELARALGCSPNTLYKLAPTRESLFALLLRRWLDGVLDAALEKAEQVESPAARARTYYRAAMGDIASVSQQFRLDVAAFGSTRMVWADASAKFVGQFADFINMAIEAGEVRPINARFLALMFRQIALVARDEETVAECGLTNEEALHEVELLIWEGIATRS